MLGHQHDIYIREMCQSEREVHYNKGVTGNISWLPSLSGQWLPIIFSCCTNIFQSQVKLHFNQIHSCSSDLTTIFRCFLIK